MVAVIDILRIRFAGAYTAAIAAIETNRRITPKEIIGNCHTADGKCPAIRKSYSDLLSGKPIAQPTNDYDDCLPAAYKTIQTKTVHHCLYLKCRNLLGAFP